MNIFTQPVTNAYNLTDATWEIVIMLLVAFVLGWVFNYFWSKTNNSNNGNTVLNNVPEQFTNAIDTDLKVIEGIGPKIEELLKASGIKTWQDLAAVDNSTLKNILVNGGDRFQMHDPASWSDQAALAAEGKFKDLEEYQDLLIGGRSN